MKRFIIAVVAVFVLWSVLDLIIHGIILNPTYQATPELWRPHDQMKMGLMYFVGFISAIIFVAIYAAFFAKRGIGTGLLYGILFGLAAGLSMGFGTYSVMPIPGSLAVGWFLGALVETTIAGLVLGAIIRKQPCCTP